MLKLEGNQPKEHNNSNNKTPSIFPFPLNFLVWGYITGTQIMLNTVMLKVVVVFLLFFFLIQEAGGFSALPTHKKRTLKKKRTSL